MFKGGGTAGGGKKGSNLEFIKHQPKFIQNIRLQYAQKERGSL